MLSVTVHGPLSENSSYTKHKPITVVVSIDVKIKEPFSEVWLMVDRTDFQTLNAVMCDCQAAIGQCKSASLREARCGAAEHLYCREKS